MNKKQYNNVIEYTLNHSEANDSLSTAREIFTNMGVALPNGTMKEVADTLATNDYMGWRECTAQQAQAAADNGTAAIGISEDDIIILAAQDEETPVTATASVMTLSETTTADGMSYYAYSSGTTEKTPNLVDYAKNKEPLVLSSALVALQYTRGFCSLSHFAI